MREPYQATIAMSMAVRAWPRTSGPLLPC